MDSSVRLPVDDVLPAARAELREIYEHRESRCAEFVRAYYRKYLRWFAVGRLFPWSRQRSAMSFEEYLAGFNPEYLTLGESLRYSMLGSYAYVVEERLEEVIALCEASADGFVTLGPKHCRAIGYPKQPLPRTRRQEELHAARQELDGTVELSAQ